MFWRWISRDTNSILSSMTLWLISKGSSSITISSIPRGIVQSQAPCFLLTSLLCLSSLNYLGDVKFIASALSWSKIGRHPGLPTKFRWRNIKVSRKKNAPPRENISQTLHDLALTASLSSSRSPSKHLS